MCHWTLKPEPAGCVPIDVKNTVERQSGADTLALQSLRKMSIAIRPGHRRLEFDVSTPLSLEESGCFCRANFTNAAVFTER
jgi:hypothetical protein